MLNRTCLSENPIILQVFDWLSCHEKKEGNELFHRAFSNDTLS